MCVLHAVTSRDRCSDCSGYTGAAIHVRCFAGHSSTSVDTYVGHVCFPVCYVFTIFLGFESGCIKAPASIPVPLPRLPRSAAA